MGIHTYIGTPFFKNKKLGQVIKQRWGGGGKILTGQKIKNSKKYINVIKIIKLKKKLLHTD